MQVRMLQEVEYKPTPEDNFRCVGQLQLKASRIVKEIDVDRLDEAGKVIETIHTAKTICGPMVTYFPVGATPDLAPDIAMGFVAAGIAERIDLDVQLVSTAEILKDVAKSA